MKTVKILVTALLSLAAAGLYAQTDSQDSTGLPGDNFSLEGALEMFKKSESPEEFEKLLNAEDNKVNNLDLNGDGEIDYIKVIDKADQDVHAFVLQAAVSATESQDVAVIEMEKNGDDKATLQIIGDEDLYGEQKIIEPTEQVNVNAGTSTNTNIVNVSAWPVVRYVYRPSYRVWVSPWGWNARPVWWRPWRPLRYSVFYPFRAPYQNHYVVVYNTRVVRAHRMYTPMRTTSVIVRTRHQASVNVYRSSKTVRTNNGQRVETKRTTVRGRGNGRVRSTRVKVRRTR